MRLLAIVCAVSILLAHHAMAQVTVDLRALRPLPDHPGPTPGPTPGPIPRSTAVRPPRIIPPTPPRSAPVARESGTATTPPQAGTAPPTVAKAAPPPAPAPALPDHTPQTATITPVEPPPSAAPPPPPPISQQAATAAAPTPGGMRLTFAPGQSDLSPASAADIKQFASAVPPGGSTTFNVLAYAPGAKDDPSSARRLSLARAMAVRGALVADGVESARIFVRALGTQYGSGPPDRVDVDVLGDNAATAK